ncbi:MAG: Mth938-like domain-containing protein [Desulfurococcales archaeon]|nr:Mth938-like domain-containing protein [Desulfurococcales archaeon]
MGQPLIDGYDFGRLEIGGEVITQDVVITPQRVVKGWWRLEGHRLQIPDVRDFLAEDVDAVVVGTGYDGMMRVDDDVVDAFRRRGREVFVLRSREAVKKYNELVRAGRKVLLLIHLTC